MSDAGPPVSRAMRLHREHVLTPWSTLTAEEPLAVTTASGSHVIGENGTAYLDFTSQLVYSNVGHGHPKLIRAVQLQALKLAAISPAHVTEVRGRAAEAIVRVAPETFSRVFFTNGGADANENAIRMARDHTGRTKVLSFYNSYHGATGAAINATGDWRRQRNEFGFGHIRAFGPNVRQSLFASTTEEEEAERAFQYLEKVVLHEGPDTIAAMIVEPIVGSSGILIPPRDYLQRMRTLTSEHGVVLIFDEVMTGFGRTGKWFALEHTGVIPDLITFAKGVNSGYIPTGGVLLNEDIAHTWTDRPYPGGLTYSGHPLAMASILASIEVLRGEHLIERAARLGDDVLRPELTALCHDLNVVADVRGVGLLWAIELVSPHRRRDPDARTITVQVARKARHLGLLVLAIEDRIHIAPPLTISEEEARQGIRILREALESASR